MVEVFIAIVLIAGVMALIITERYVEGDDLSSEIYTKEALLLKKIQLNDTFRQEIVTYAGILPVASYDENFPEKTLDMINLELPSDLECYSKICDITDPCIGEEIQGEAETDVYAMSVSIFATIDDYAPKQVKLFCWKK